jgi:hypothetical protein
MRAKCLYSVDPVSCCSSLENSGGFHERQEDFCGHLQSGQGQPLQYKLSLTENELFNVGSGIESALRGNYVGVEPNKKLILVPIQNVQSIEIDPSPQRLIAHVVQGAEPLS